MRTLIDALPYLAGGVALVALVALFVSDRAGANEHDVSDYHPRARAVGEPAPVNVAPRSLRRFEALDSRPIPATMRVRYDFDISPEPADDILPPAPPGMDAGSPLFGAVAVDMAVPTLTDDEVRQRAAEILRELGEQARLELAR